MRPISLLLFLVLTQSCFAQFKLAKPGKKSIPKSVNYSGKLLQAVRWTDSTGDNLVILTEPEKTASKSAPDGGYSDGTLWAGHFILSGDSARQTWRVYDYVKECPVDMFLYFIDSAFAVTDLDKNGKAEVWIMYKVSCQGDVSPVPMKIIMYEDNKKFAARGTTRVQASADSYMGGEFSFDDAFRNAPAVFRKYAETLWAKHVAETWQQ